MYCVHWSPQVTRSEWHIKFPYTWCSIFSITTIGKNSILEKKGGSEFRCRLFVFKFLTTERRWRKPIPPRRIPLSGCTHAAKVKNPFQSAKSMTGRIRRGTKKHLRRVCLQISIIWSCITQRHSSVMLFSWSFGVNETPYDNAKSQEKSARVCKLRPHLSCSSVCIWTSGHIMPWLMVQRCKHLWGNFDLKISVLDGLSRCSRFCAVLQFQESWRETREMLALRSREI